MEMPLVSALQKKLRNNPNVQFIALEYGDEQGVGRQYFKENGFEMLLLDSGHDRTPQDKWAVQGFPTIIIIGPDGKESKRFVGYHDSVATDIEAELKRLGVLK